MLTNRIFHVTEPELWEDALENGSYTGSTRGQSLREVGFIHCSFEEQVEMVASFVYPDWDGELVLLAIDTERLDADVRVENLDGGEEQFPHIYGALPTAAVTAVYPMTKSDGGWRLPPGL